MTMKPMGVEIRCVLSRKFPIAAQAITLLRYKLEALPTVQGSEQEAILSFTDTMKENSSNPQEEGKMLLSVLALVFDSRISPNGFRIDGIDLGQHVPTAPAAIALFDGEIPDSPHATAIGHLFTLGDNLTKQFVRACNAYSLAITSTTIDTSLSFLLLVTALESIATQEEFCPNEELDKSKKSVERYCRLVKQYCLNRTELFPSDGEEGFIRNLKTVYYNHRSAFVHAGHEVSVASEIADRHGKVSLGHIVDNRDVFTPGLKWFFQVTRRTLLGFLAGHPRAASVPNEEALADVARERAILTMRFGREKPK